MHLPAKNSYRRGSTEPTPARFVSQREPPKPPNKCSDRATGNSSTSCARRRPGKTENNLDTRFCKHTSIWAPAIQSTEHDLQFDPTPPCRIAEDIPLTKNRLLLCKPSGATAAAVRCYRGPQICTRRQSYGRAKMGTEHRCRHNARNRS